MTTSDTIKSATFYFDDRPREVHQGRVDGIGAFVVRGSSELFRQAHTVRLEDGRLLKERGQ